MVTTDRYLVVVSVLEGRKFPKRPKHKLIAEARFDGELLATDPVDHVEAPDFTQELAWEVNKKGLHQHRLQRTSIKVQCYALDPQSTMREMIGYVVLDLRSAQNKQTNRWLPLLHSKYHKSKPEIRLGIYIDDDKGSAQSSFKATEAPARKGNLPSESPSEVSEIDPKTLKPVLNEIDGYYQLGPENKCTDFFLLSVTVSFAANLPQLLPTNMPLPSSANGYFFYYSLFGNDVTNEAFYDLLNPNFPPERASVRLRSSVEALRMFLEKQPGIQIHLCCGDQSLGSSEVPLNSLLKKDSTEIYMRPVSNEGAFKLVPPNRMRQQLPPVPEDMTPVVGVSVVLRKEEQISVTPSKDAGVPRPSTPPALESQPKYSDSPPQKLQREDRKPSSPPPEEQYSESFEEEKTGGDLSSLHEEEQKKEKRHRDTEKPHEEKRQRTPSPEPLPPPPAQLVPPGPHLPPGPPQDASSSSAHPHVAVPALSHHYSVSIDLRTIRDMQTASAVNVVLRYTYPFFGSAAPIMTHPAVEVRRGREVVLPQSFCAFEFATTQQQLQDTFLRVPLLVEVYDRDKQRAQDVLLGVARISLAQILNAEQTRSVRPDGSTVWRQVFSERVPVVATEGPASKVAEIHAVLTLEDLGPIPTQHVYVGSETTSQVQSTSSHAPAPPAQPAPPVQQPPPEPRETMEYKTAMELEMWKETQEHMFENQLKEKEGQHMRVLAEEWKRRDKEREILVQKKLAEYSQLEEQLRKTIANLDKRERQLAANEQEVLRLRGDLQREHDLKLVELKEASRRLQEDCDHRVQLERAKTQELEQQLAKLKTELTEFEMKYQALDREFASYRAGQSNKPEVRLQSEINLLTLEKVELERKIDSLTKSKVHYKQQWGRALKELARLKEKEQAVARKNLRKQQQELEHMRLRYLAAEEKEVVKADTKELENIKTELNKLKELEAQKLQLQAELQDRSRHSSENMRPLQPDPDATFDERITKLIEERDALLKTGVYTHDDRIIAELDRQIREAIAHKRS